MDFLLFFSTQCDQELDGALCSFPSASVLLHDESRSVRDGVRVSHTYLFKSQEFILIFSSKIMENLLASSVELLAFRLKWKIDLFGCSLENRKTVVRIDGLNQGKWLSGLSETEVSDKSLPELSSLLIYWTIANVCNVGKLNLIHIQGKRLAPPTID